MADVRPIEALRNGLFVIDQTRRLGRMTGATLGRCSGWNPVRAHRYLHELALLGWLDKVTDAGQPVYVLGPKVLELSPELEF